MFALIRPSSRFLREICCSTGSNTCRRWMRHSSYSSNRPHVEAQLIYSESELMDKLEALETERSRYVQNYSHYTTFLSKLHPRHYPAAMSTILVNLYRRHKKALYKMDVSPLLQCMYGLYIKHPCDATYQSHHLSNILIAAFALHPRHAKTMTRLLSFVRPHMPTAMAADDIVACYRALQTLPYQPHLHTYYDLLHYHAATPSTPYRQHHLADIFYGLSHNKIPGCDELLLYFYHQHLITLTEPLTASSIATVAYSLRCFTNAEPQAYVDSVIPYLVQQLERCDMHLNATDLAMTMHGLRFMKFTSAIDKLIQALVSKLHHPMTLTSRNIGDIFQGLLSITSPHDSMDQLFDVLTMWFHTTSASTTSFTLQAGYIEHFSKIPLYESDASLRFVSAVLRLFPKPSASVLSIDSLSQLCWCFRNFGTSETITTFLNFVNEHMQQQISIHPKALIRILCSLQCQSSQNIAVRELMAELVRLSRVAKSEKIRSETTFELSPKDFAVLMLGMQSMNTVHQSVRAMFGLLEELMPAGEYTAENMKLVCRGLQQADSSVALLLRRITDCVRNMKDNFTVNQFATCIFGLRSMNDCDAAYDLIAALQQRCPSLTGVKAHEAAWILFGTHQLEPQKLTRLHQDVRAVLSDIDQWTPLTLSNCIYGLATAVNETSMMIHLLNELRKCYSDIDEAHILRLLQTLRIVSVYHTDETVQQLLEWLVDHIQEGYVMERRPVNELLRRFVDAITELRPHYAIHCNAFIDNFPVDLLLSLCRRTMHKDEQTDLDNILPDAKNYHLLNIQIEGVSMRTSYHKHNLQHRDRYLREKYGIHTCRIDIRKIEEVPSLVTLLRRELFLYRLDADSSEEEVK